MKLNVETMESQWNLNRKDSEFDCDYLHLWQYGQRDYLINLTDRNQLSKQSSSLLNNLKTN